MFNITEEQIMEGMIDEQIIRGMVEKQKFDDRNARALLLFTPYLARKRAVAFLNKTRLVHYTSAITTNNCGSNDEKKD